MIAPTAWLRGSGETTDGQLARRWTVYLSREPFAERSPCTGQLRRPPRALGALTRPVHQLRRGCQHRERRRCRLSALIPGRVSAQARGAAAKTMASFLKAILTRAHSSQVLKDRRHRGGCKLNKCNTTRCAWISPRRVYVRIPPDCLCVSV